MIFTEAHLFLKFPFLLIFLMTWQKQGSHSSFCSLCEACVFLNILRSETPFLHHVGLGRFSLEGEMKVPGCCITWPMTLDWYHLVTPHPRPQRLTPPSWPSGLYFFLVSLLWRNCQEQSQPVKVLTRRFTCPHEEDIKASYTLAASGSLTDIRNVKMIISLMIKHQNVTLIFIFSLLIHLYKIYQIYATHKAKEKNMIFS